MLARLGSLSFVALCLTAPVAADDAGQEGPPPAASEMMRLGLRGVHFVPNHGQWADEEVVYGLKSRGLDIAFRESSFTMHLSREQGSTSRAREEAGLGGEREDVPAEFDDRHSLVSDYGGQLSDHRAPLSRGRRAPLPHRSGSSGDLLHHEIRGVEDSAPAYERLTLAVSFPGSNSVAPRGVAPQTAKFNYFVGDDELRWASDVPSYGMIVYEGIYDGIDLHVTGHDDGVLKYEFHCAPGADYTQIRIRYEGIDALCIDEGGDLHISTIFGTLRDGAPVVWQEAVGESEDGGTAVPAVQQESGGTGVPPVEIGSMGVSPVDRSAAAENGRDARSTGKPTLPARFELIDDHTYCIALATAPDPALPLIIDPEVEWMYYLGGMGYESGHGIAVDSADNALVVGESTSPDFAGRNNSHHGGASEAFALKVSPSGELQWMTYLGGSDRDEGWGIAVDSDDNALLTGRTQSMDFAGRNNSSPSSQCAFALKVSPSGQLQWMTYLGGSSGEYAWGIAVDSAGNAIVTGRTWSTDFVGRNNSKHGDSDAYAVKVKSSGQLLWMTYLGGSDSDEGTGIAADSDGNVLVTGWTWSTDFAGRNNSYQGGPSDIFSLKVSPSGEFLWMTYLGGNGRDLGLDVAADGEGNALVTGYTRSTFFTGRNNSYYGGEYDAFALKVGPSGQLDWMTYLGGSESDEGWGIAVDDGGNALVTGYTNSTDFAGRNNSFNGSRDAFALRVSPSGQLQWMTYLGGGIDDKGYSIAVDSAGDALVTGYTDSTDFAGRNNSYYGGRNDAFIVKLCLSPRLSVDATCPDGGPIRIEWSNATPNGRVAMIFARETGSVTIPPDQSCAGTTLGLGRNQIHFVVRPWSDGDGAGYVTGIAGAGACGGYLQLLDLTPCATSNVARIE